MPRPAFLAELHIVEGCAEARLGARAVAALLALAARIARVPELTTLAAGAHHALYETEGEYRQPLERADAALADDAALLHALFVLDSLRLVRTRQAARGVSPEITRAVNERHGISFLRGSLDSAGVPRLDDWLPFWFRLVASGELYRLGRLEFAPDTWRYPFRVYVRTKDGSALMLAETGVGFSADGLSRTEPTWFAELAETPDAVVGTPMCPSGRALPERLRLPLAEWQLALGAGDRVLDLHVPVEGELSLPALRDAFARAEPFFDQYHPEPPFRAYVCDSWLFSNQLEALLGPGEPSNILRWQREGYLLPGAGGHAVFLKFVFGKSDVDPAHAPRDTRLRHAVLARLARGERLQDGQYVFLRRDLARFGSQPYRSQTPALIEGLVPRLH